MTDSVRENGLLNGWIPWRLVEQEGELLVQWLFVGQKDFVEPFFDDTILKCRQLPENRTGFGVFSDLQCLVDWSASLPPAAPVGLIFHVSRCGSTLLSQNLATDPKNLSLSEVPLFDQILRLCFRDNLPPEWSIHDLLRSAVAIYASTRSLCARLFLKVDSWHLYFYEQYRQIFPQAKVIFLYREPAAVCASQGRQRGLHAVPGMLEAALFGLNSQDPHYRDFEGYFSRVLLSYYRAMTQWSRQDAEILLLDYQMGMAAIFDQLDEILGLGLDEETKARIAQRSRFDAKRPGALFEEASETGTSGSSMPDLLQAYRQLDGIRLQVALG